MEEGYATDPHHIVENSRSHGQEALHSYRMQLTFFLGENGKATELYGGLKGAKVLKGYIFYPARIFFFALINLANYPLSGERKLKGDANKYTGIIRKLVVGGAIVLIHELQILEAELPSLTCKDADEVCHEFDRGIVSAARSGFLHHATLANCLCAQFYRSRLEKNHVVERYILKSHELWMTWGTISIVESLVKRYPCVFVNETSLSGSAVGSTGVKSRTRFDGLVTPLNCTNP
jgi:hypothetical protein